MGTQSQFKRLHENHWWYFCAYCDELEKRTWPDSTVPQILGITVKIDMYSEPLEHWLAAKMYFVPIILRFLICRHLHTSLVLFGDCLRSCRKSAESPGTTIRFWYTKSFQKPLRDMPKKCEAWMGSQSQFKRLPEDEWWLLRLLRRIGAKNATREHGSADLGDCS